ncbi:MAG: hypothetical protein ACXVKQ_07145 [Acidimicrobiia bacterium]
MRRIYTCLLELADASSAAPRVARALTKRWVGRAYGGWPEHAPERWQPEPGVTVRWRLLDHPERADEAFELVWTRPHAQDATLWRRATVQITTTGRAGRVLILEQLESADPKVRAAPAQRVARPALVPEIVREVECVDGGWSVTTTPHRVSASRAADLDAFVRGDRRLPVVLVAPDARGVVLADAARFADDLVALAHVVVLDGKDAVAALDAELGAGRGAPPGGVRLLWPSWRSSDPPGHHPSWRAEEVSGPEGPRARVAEILSDLVLAAATLRVEGDPLVERLARSQDTVDLQERRAELESLRTAVLDDRAAAEELIAEYQSELSRADEQVYLLEADLERERELRLRFEQGYLTLATGGADPSLGATGLVAPTNGTLGDVVRRAKATRPHLVILPEAERSASEWRYDRGDLVELDLARLDSVAAQWASGALRGDFGTACRNQGLDWVRDVSASAKQKYAEDYLRSYQGRPIMLGPHFRRDGRQLVRVYCFLDEEQRRVVVGHVGRHLRDRTT